MLIRTAVVAAFICAAALLLAERGRLSACRDARQVVLAQTIAADVEAAAVRRVASDCRDAEAIAITASGLARVDPQAARQLAEIALRRAPDTFAPWAALAAAQATADPAAARRAWQQAKRLNRRWQAGPPAAQP